MITEMHMYKWYKIRHRSSVQQYDRKSVMQYLGVVESSIHTGRVEHQFNARPVAGTQHIYDDEIISTEEVFKQEPYVGARW